MHNGIPRHRCGDRKSFLQTVSSINRWAIAAATIVPLLLAGCAPQPQYTVTRIIDGDSIEVTLPSGEIKRVDLAYIDAPEKEQPMGREATQYLQNALLNKNIHFDQQQRLLLQDKVVALTLLELGLVWERSENATFDIQQAYQDAQQKAIQHEQGIWRLDHALRVPPWQWRQNATQVSDYQRRKQANMTGNNKDTK